MKLNELLNDKFLLGLASIGTTLDLRGYPGIGKSTVVRQIPKILSRLTGQDYGYHEELVPSIDAPDVRGFMVPTKTADGSGVVSHYTYPAILPSPEYLKAHPFGVLFLDEFEQGDQLTKKSLAPLILEGKVGNYSLPRGWWRITASNRVEDRSGVAKPLMHIVNRRATIDIDNDVESWATWADTYVHPVTGRRLHPLAKAFARHMPNVLFSPIPADSAPFCTPRSYVAAWDLLTSMCDVDEQGYVSNTIPTDGILWEFVQGSIGKAAATQLMAYTKVATEMPTFPEVLADPMRAKMPSSQRLDAGYAVVQMCLHYIAPENLQKVWAYLERLPRELQVSVAAQIMTMSKVNGTLLGSPEFAKWMTRNTALLQASQS